MYRGIQYYYFCSKTVLTSTHNLFWAEMWKKKKKKKKKKKNFYLKLFMFLLVKFSIYSKRLVFVMLHSHLLLLQYSQATYIVQVHIGRDASMWILTGKICSRSFVYRMTGQWFIRKHRTAVQNKLYDISFHLWLTTIPSVKVYNDR